MTRQEGFVCGPMKILAISDIHGNGHVYEWIPALIRDHGIDALVLAGDLVGGHGNDLTIEEAQRRESEQIIKILQSLQIPVSYIMGNDDMVELGYQDALVHPIHFIRRNLQECNFVGYQFSPPFMGGIFEKPENEIGRDLLQIEPLLDDKTVLVTHSPAYGILDVADQEFHVGSPSIAKVIELHPVRAHIHGHIHKCFGREGNHFNVAAGGDFRAMVIDLDNLAHKVVTADKKDRLSGPRYI